VSDAAGAATAAAAAAAQHAAVATRGSCGAAALLTGHCTLAVVVPAEEVEQAERTSSRASQPLLR
jgi:hypothetical protein